MDITKGFQVVVKNLKNAHPHPSQLPGFKWNQCVFGGGDAHPVMVHEKPR